MKDPHRAFETLFIISEIILAILYLFCTEYGEGVHPSYDTAEKGYDAADFVQKYYPMFQDVHVMIFVGFGFLMVFLKTHSWTSVGYNFVISAFALQWTIICQGFFHMAIVEGEFHKINLDIPALIIGDFGAGAVMITFGAVLGKVSLMQIWMIAFFEIIFYSINESICAGLMQAVDMGGSMYVHTFGAYFGVACSFFFFNKQAIKDEKDRCGGTYNSQLIAMVGTIFLWMYWPSFNGALAASSQQQRVIVNTVLAISASCVSAVGVSRIMLQRIDMEVLLNATLAGGVAVGSASDLVVTGGVSMFIGGIAGIVSAFGFLKLNGFLQSVLGLHDTCGVHNLHGLPGILGAIFGSISAALSDSTFNKGAIDLTFPAMADGRTASSQGWFQIGALAVTLFISLVGGLITGFITSRCCAVEELFDDKEHFHEAEYEEVNESEMKDLKLAAESARD